MADYTRVVPLGSNYAGLQRALQQGSTI
jgi:hypothetical protein